MKKLIVFASFAVLFTSCKVVRIEGTPNVSVTNSEANPVPVTVQNGPGVQRVEVTNFPATGQHPAPTPERRPYSVSRRLSSKNGFKLDLVVKPAAGYDLVVKYYAVSLDDHISTVMKLENFQRTFAGANAARTESEKCHLLVNDGSSLTFTAVQHHHDKSVTVYVSGYEVKK